MNPIKNAKNALRKEMKQKLNLLTSEEKNRQSEVVKNKLFSMPQYQNSKRMSVFLNMSDEIQTLGILKDAFKMNKICFIPRYDSSSNHMDMVRIDSWQDFESLPETKWKIKQPLIEDERETALSSGGLDLILVPGLAFTKCGKRLGRGRGYYDTYLNRCIKGQDQSPLTVALTFKEQIVPDIPTSDADVPVINPHNTDLLLLLNQDSILVYKECERRVLPIEPRGTRHSSGTTIYIFFGCESLLQIWFV